MIEIFKQFLYDGTFFVRVVRSLCLAVGGALATGQLTDAEWSKPVGVVIAALAGMFAAGEKNKG